jgi:vesicle-associated membrane protein 7
MVCILSSSRRVLERGERIELLVDKTEELRNHAQMFQKQGKALRSNMWWQNMRMKIIVVLVVLLLVVVIFLLACFAGAVTVQHVLCASAASSCL